jgi:hypothetical protein
LVGTFRLNALHVSAGAPADHAAARVIERASHAACRVFISVDLQTGD